MTEGSIAVPQELSITLHVLSAKHFLRIYAGESCLPEGFLRIALPGLRIKMANPGDFCHHPGVAEITLVELTLNFICIMIILKVFNFS